MELIIRSGPGNPTPSPACRTAKNMRYRERDAARMLENYVILDKLSRGGPYVVYKAIQKGSDREVVVKMMPRELNASDTAKSRYRRCVDAFSGIDHPNIVRFVDEGNEGGQYYYAMPYVGTDTLRSQLARRRKPLSLWDAVNFTGQLAVALSELHRKGVVHEDVKPASIFVGRDKSLTLADFGLQWSLRDIEMVGVEGWGKDFPKHVAPEMVKGEPADRRTDLYQLGMVLYELLTSKWPYGPIRKDMKLEEALDQDPVPPSQFNADVPPALEAICLKLLARDPEARYQSAEELLDDLGPVVEGLGDAPRDADEPVAETVAVESLPSREERDGRSASDDEDDRSVRRGRRRGRGRDRGDETEASEDDGSRRRGRGRDRGDETEASEDDGSRRRGRGRDRGDETEASEGDGSRRRGRGRDRGDETEASEDDGSRRRGRGRDRGDEAEASEGDGSRRRGRGRDRGDEAEASEGDGSRRRGRGRDRGDETEASEDDGSRRRGRGRDRGDETEASEDDGSRRRGRGRDRGDETEASEDDRSRRHGRDRNREDENGPSEDDGARRRGRRGRRFEGEGASEASEAPDAPVAREAQVDGRRRDGEADRDEEGEGRSRRSRRGRRGRGRDRDRDRDATPEDATPAIPSGNVSGDAAETRPTEKREGRRGRRGRRDRFDRERPRDERDERSRGAEERDGAVTEEGDGHIYPMPILLTLLVGFVLGLLTHYLPPQIRGANYWVENVRTVAVGDEIRASWQTGLPCHTVVFSVTRDGTQVRFVANDAKPGGTARSDHSVLLGKSSELGGRRHYVLFPDGTTQEIEITP